MTRNKDLKRLTRARMDKTGESYSTARAQLLRKAAAPPVAAASEPPPDYATLAGISDEAVKAKTGCDWKRWVEALDYAGAASMSHREIADYVHTKWKIPGWWAQTVTVGYERIKGLRAIGQRRDGTYETSKSRTFGVPVAELYAACAEETERRRWLGGARLEVRTATADKSMRLTWEDGSPVDFYFTAKTPDKSQLAVQHRKLPSKAEADRLKAFWATRLEALRERLAT
jgi:hypothetical protein